MQIHANTLTFYANTLVFYANPCKYCRLNMCKYCHLLCKYKRFLCKCIFCSKSSKYFKTQHSFPSCANAPGFGLIGAKYPFFAQIVKLLSKTDIFCSKVSKSFKNRYFLHICVNASGFRFKMIEFA